MQTLARWGFNWGFAACAGLLAVLMPVLSRRRRLRADGKLHRRCDDQEVLAQVASVCARYGLSPLGFLPQRCLERLPNEFKDWELLSESLPELNRSGGLAKAIEALPHVDPKHLQGARSEVLHRAYFLLGALSHSYVHRHAVPWNQLGGPQPKPNGCAKKLPAQLAEPWLQVCAQLGMPPVLTAAATDLWNWRLRDASGPFVLANLEQCISLTGTATERYFHMVPCAMQAAAAQVVPKLFLADILVRRECDEQLTELLLEVADVLKQFQDLFRQIPGSVDKDVFYDIYRPLLNGFHPDGVLLEVSSPEKAGFWMESVAGLQKAEGSLLNTSKGPSAGQSTVILLLDSFLAVSHNKAGLAFQDEMLTYMPAEHRQMVLDFRQRWQDLDTLPLYISKRKALGGVLAAQLQAAFDESVEALCGLRRLHLSTVTGYLVRTSKGTGATTWRSLLQSMLSATSLRLSRT